MRPVVLVLGLGPVRVLVAELATSSEASAAAAEPLTRCLPPCQFGLALELESGCVAPGSALLDAEGEGEDAEDEDEWGLTLCFFASTEEEELALETEGVAPLPLDVSDDAPAEDAGESGPLEEDGDDAEESGTTSAERRRP